MRDFVYGSFVQPIGNAVAAISMQVSSRHLQAMVENLAQRCKNVGRLSHRSPHLQACRYDPNHDQRHIIFGSPATLPGHAQNDGTDSHNERQCRGAVIVLFEYPLPTIELFDLPNG